MDINKGDLSAIWSSCENIRGCHLYKPHCSLSKPRIRSIKKGAVLTAPFTVRMLKCAQYVRPHQKNPDSPAIHCRFFPCPSIFRHNETCCQGRSPARCLSFLVWVSVGSAVPFPGFRLPRWRCTFCGTHILQRDEVENICQAFITHCSK